MKNGNKSDNGVLEVGTEEICASYEADTPGQSEKVEKYIRSQKKDQMINAKKHFSQVFGNPLKGFPYNEEFDVELAEAVEELATLEEGDTDAAIRKKADKSGMPFGILKKVFNRGVAAWRTGHRPGTNPTQWGLARVNSFTTKSKGTWGGADKDLASKVS